MAQLTYINPDAPAPPAVRLEGETYNDLVPATLDLAERCRLAVHALTETLDHDLDEELYWVVDLLGSPPQMWHTYDDQVQDKFFEALPLCRLASGSDENLDVEHRLMHAYLKKQGPDGLIYWPLKERPWGRPKTFNAYSGMDEAPKGDHLAHVLMMGRVLGAFVVYSQKHPDGPWAEAARKLCEGLKKLFVRDPENPQHAYLFQTVVEPGYTVTHPKQAPKGVHAGNNGWVIQGLAQYHRYFSDEEAIDLAGAAARYLFENAEYFTDEGHFYEKGGPAHFHLHSNVVMATLEVVQAGGDPELLYYAKRSFMWGYNQGDVWSGSFPEGVNRPSHLTYHGCGHDPSEICEVADMIVCAIKLAKLGEDERWDDVDRWVRNMLAEGQLTQVDWLRDGSFTPIDREREPIHAAGSASDGWIGTTDNVADRCVGSFSGWPDLNDWFLSTGGSIQHCCTGNGTRALYYVWQSMLEEDGQDVRVNLLLNRASQHFDLHSHIPYSGRVDFKIKQPTNLTFRSPKWCEVDQIQCTVNDQPVTPKVENNFVHISNLQPGDVLTAQLPLAMETHDVVYEKQLYTITRRGYDIVHVTPPGKHLPLYQRGHYRSGTTHWIPVQRRVDPLTVQWA